MMRSKRMLISCILALSSVLSAGQFVADMHIVGTDATALYKLYAKDRRYRMEFVEDEHPMLVIVDLEEGLTRVARPDDRLYFEIPCNDARSILNDPYQSLAFMELMGENESLGTEIIRGFDCEKVRVTYKDRDVATYWTPEELGLPLKIVMYPPNDRVVELVEIREMELDDSLFRIPEDFTLFEY
jgi:hypothetical protein